MDNNERNREHNRDRDNDFNIGEMLIRGISHSHSNSNCSIFYHQDFQ